MAYRILYQEEEPGWMTMLERGATTVWEAWNGIDEEGNPQESLNHYSKGAVISFLHEYTVGIRPLAPGYERFEIRPHLAPDVSWAEGSLRTPHGDVRVRWEVSGTEVTVAVDVPTGTTASIHLPDGTRRHADPGEHSFASALPEPPTRTPYADIRGNEPAPVADDSVAEELGAWQWGRFDPDTTTLGELLDDAQARSVFDEIAPELADDPMIAMARPVPFSTVLGLAADALDRDQVTALCRRLAAL